MWGEIAKHYFQPSFKRASMWIKIGIMKVTKKRCLGQGARWGGLYGFSSFVLRTSSFAEEISTMTGLKLSKQYPVWMR